MVANLLVIHDSGMIKVVRDCWTGPGINKLILPYV